MAGYSGPAGAPLLPDLPTGEAGNLPVRERWCGNTTTGEALTSVHPPFSPTNPPTKPTGDGNQNDLRRSTRSTLQSALALPITIHACSTPNPQSTKPGRPKSSQPPNAATYRKVFSTAAIGRRASRMARGRAENRDEIAQLRRLHGRKEAGRALAAEPPLAPAFQKF